MEMLVITCQICKEKIVLQIRDDEGELVVRAAHVDCVVVPRAVRG